MSWAPAFLDALDAGESMVFRVVAGSLDTIATSNGAAGLRMVRAPLVTGWGLQLRTWASSLPVMSLVLAGTPADYQTLVGAHPLGRLVRVYADWSGGTELIWFGRILDYSLGAVPEQTTIRVDVADWVAYSIDRTEDATYPGPLFDGVGRMVRQSFRLDAFAIGEFDGSLPATFRADYTTLAGGFQPGVSTVVDVASTSNLPLGWDYAASAALGGAILAGPRGLEATVYFAAKTSTQLQTLTYPQMPSGTPADPPFASSYSIGDEVYPVAIVAGHPFTVIMGVWTSTGTAGANGPYDQLPAAWGQAIPFTLTDATDWARWSALCYTSAVGSDPYVAIQTRREWPSGADLYAWAAPLGIWPVARQGALSLRAAVEPAAVGAAVVAGAVTDGNLLAIGRHKVRAAGCDAEYRALPFAHATYHATNAAGVPTPVFTLGRSNTTPITRPAQYSPEPLDLTQHIVAETAPIAQDIGRRLAPWACRVAMEVEGVEVFGRAVGWVPGDIVTVTSASIPVGGGAVAVDTPALWVPAEVDWETRTARGRLVFLPQQ